MTQTVENRWSGQPFTGIRQLDQQQFQVDKGENPGIKPETVIDSRLTPMVERFISSGVEQIEGSHLTDNLSYEASLEELTSNDSRASSRPVQETRVAVSGGSINDSQKGFELRQQSRLTQPAGTKTWSSLFETAHGSC